MIILILTLVFGTIIFSLCVIAEGKHWNNAIGFFSVIAMILALLVALGSAVALPFYYGASVKAGLLNRELNTTYTTEEVFFAANIIEEIRHIQRQRIDANINLEQTQ